MNKSKTHMGCREISRYLGMNIMAVSSRGRAERWPGAYGTRWKVPCDFIEKLKLSQEVDSQQNNPAAKDLRYARSIIDQVLWNEKFIDDANNFERLRAAVSNLDLVIDNITNDDSNDFDPEKLKNLAESLRSSKGVKNRAKAAIAILDHLKINNTIVEKLKDFTKTT
jgi:hypothetical protein